MVQLIFDFSFIYLFMNLFICDAIATVQVKL